MENAHVEIPISINLLQQAEKLARLEAELHLQRRADEERAAIAAHRADMEKEARRRDQVAKEAELRHRALRELSPVEITDCFDRYFKLPYISVPLPPALHGPCVGKTIIPEEHQKSRSLFTCK
jgi:hypothetical protein